MAEPAILALEDGTVFNGISVGAEGRTLGEVVFNTAMTGYQEILTDPSYYRQIVTLTYPHIGNTGTNSDDFESPKIFAAGLIIRDLSATVSSWRAEDSLEHFLKRGKTVAIAEHRHAAAHANSARQGRAGRLHHDRRQGRSRTRRFERRASFPV